MTIGQRIAALRKQAGLSQEALAAQLNVSRQAIGKWEADASLPGLDNLQELARALGVSCDELLTGEKRPSAADQPEPLAGAAPSLEGIQALFAESEQRRQRCAGRRGLAAADPLRQPDKLAEKSDESGHRPAERPVQLHQQPH